MTEVIKGDDYACLHHAYYEDTDLCIISDQLADEHDAGWLVWLYWPRMIAAAKAAKSFGWFSTTPRQIASSVSDHVSGGAWEARARMWNLIADRKVIEVRQGRIEAQSSKVDVRIVEWQKWQSLTPLERKKLERQRTICEAGEAPHWTAEHLPMFAKFVTKKCTKTNLVSESRDNVTGNGNIVTENPYIVTTLDETRQDVRETSTSDEPIRDLNREAREVFDHWCLTMGKRSNTIFSTDRKARVLARLREGYTVSQLVEAVTGYTKIPFNMGDNADNRRWDGLELICRSGSHVEKGIEANVGASNAEAAGSHDAAMIDACGYTLGGAA